MGLHIGRGGLRFSAPGHDTGQRGQSRGRLGTGQQHIGAQIAFLAPSLFGLVVGVEPAWAVQRCRVPELLPSAGSDAVDRRFDR
jgi:hypothetical protein